MPVLFSSGDIGEFSAQSPATRMTIRAEKTDVRNSIDKATWRSQPGIFNKSLFLDIFKRFKSSLLFWSVRPLKYIFMSTIAKLCNTLDKLTPEEHVLISKLFIDFCVERRKDFNTESFRLFSNVWNNKKNRRQKIKIPYQCGKITLNATKSKKLPAFLIITLKK